MKNYNFLQKFLHDLVLNKKFVKKSFFELEKFIFERKCNFEVKNKKHIFITGLPRSGTTAILNCLYSSDEFFSLCYRDMPYIMAPNLFETLKKNKKKFDQIRFHDDGIRVNLDSPESFDEIFFLTFNQNEIREEFLIYIKLMLLKKKNKKYLSKNNNNYKRINLLQSLLPNSIFLIPFREPLQQAYSLLNQHRNFLKHREQYIRERKSKDKYPFRRK